jgi:peptide-methionine (S)-S-oxide reductase
MKGRQMSISTERAILAGGCFWGVQDLLRRYPGVLSTRVGYSGGDVPNATYRNHGTHAEAIEIVFDPAKTSFRKLLEFFFQIHDPSTLNRQGNDRGLQLPLGDLLYQRGAKARRARHDRRCRCLGPVARQGGDRGRPGRRLLGGRAGAPGLPGAHCPNGYTCHFARPNWVLPARSAAV